MKFTGMYSVTITSILVSTIVLSCKKSSEPTSSNGQVNVKMEIISYLNAPANVDSNECYLKYFIEWNSPGNPLSRDTVKCDSLVNWFAKSKYQITDLWFPNITSRCNNPIFTQNIVSLKLSSPDTSFESLGYSKTPAVVGVCYIYYRHYIFTRN